LQSKSLKGVLEKRLEEGRRPLLDGEMTLFTLDEWWEEHLLKDGEIQKYQDYDHEQEMTKMVQAFNIGAL
jgi:hypothetical protein